LQATSEALLGVLHVLATGEQLEVRVSFTIQLPSVQVTKRFSLSYQWESINNLRLFIFLLV